MGDGMTLEEAREQAEERMLCHPELLVARLGRQALLQGLEELAFPLPADLPPVVPLWRGMAGVTPEQAAAGLHWTLDRATACKYAITASQLWSAPPVVVRCQVPRARIVYFSDACFEREAVFYGVPEAVQVDDSPAEWHEAAQADILRITDAWLRAMAEGLTPLQERCLRYRVEQGNPNGVVGRILEEVKL
jgi:hypothetical protein